MYKIWFIDDEPAFRRDVKDCFNLKSEYGIYDNSIMMRIISTGIDGMQAKESITTVVIDDIPDLIFVDLRYPIDITNNETDIKKLHGVSVLKSLTGDIRYKNTMIVIFSQVSLSEDEKQYLIDLLGFENRKSQFLQKTHFGMDSISINKIAGMKIDKSCQNLRKIIDLLSKNIQ